MAESAQQGEAKPRGPSQATRCVELVVEHGADLFHDGELTFISFESNGHQETHPLRSTAVRRLIGYSYFRETGKSPNGDAIAAATNTLCGIALFRGKQRKVWFRSAEHDGEILVDLGDGTWRIIKITAVGWQLIEAKDAPVRFRRPRAMQQLPEPKRGGSIVSLRKFINAADDYDFILVLGWLVAALRPRGPFPVLILHAEPGSGKTTRARILKLLTDPNASPVRAEPATPRDLAIAAQNSFVIVWDNLSSVPPWLSDAICRLSTGGGFATRELYADSEEIIIDATRPVVLTGISEIATRGDLLERALNFRPSLDRSKRQTRRRRVLGRL